MLSDRLKKIDRYIARHTLQGCLLMLAGLLVLLLLWRTGKAGS